MTDTTPVAIYDYLSYEGEVQPTSLHELSGDVILKHDFNFYQAVGLHGEHYSDLIETGSHSPNFYLPPAWSTLIDRISVREHLQWSESVRRLIVHGLSIYIADDGDELDQIYRDIEQAIFDCNEDVLDDSDDTCRVRFDADRTSVPMTDHLREILTTKSNRAGICRERFITYLMGLSLRTNREIPKWYPRINAIIEKIGKKLKSRKEKLKSCREKLRQ